MSLCLRASTSPAFRSWLRGLQNKLKVTQRTIAQASDVSRPWLSQVMTGRRKQVDSQNMTKLKVGLIKLLKDYSGNDKTDILQRLEVEFTELADFGQDTMIQSPEAMRVAAELLQILVTRCPNSRRQRQKILDYLQFAVNEAED